MTKYKSTKQRMILLKKLAYIFAKVIFLLKKYYFKLSETELLNNEY